MGIDQTGDDQFTTEIKSVFLGVLFFERLGFANVSDSVIFDKNSTIRNDMAGSIHSNDISVGVQHDVQNGEFVLCERIKEEDDEELYNYVGFYTFLSG